MKFLKKVGVDNWVIIMMLLVASITVKNLKRWYPGHVINYDVISYYHYLPSTFIYGSPTLDTPNEKYFKYEHVFWLIPLENGGRVNKTSMGISVLYAPFFFMGHAAAYLFDYDPSGFTTPYSFAIVLSSIFYFGLGMFFLRKVLRIYFSEAVTAITLVLIGLGTNLFYYVVMAPGYAHVYVFCMLAVLVYYLHKWYEEPKLGLTIFLGFLLGLMVLSRPTLILVLPFAGLFGVRNWKDLKERGNLLLKRYGKLLLMAFVAFLVWVPQFIYWKAATGSYLFFSYTGERFFWGDPKILEVLFGFRKGWLIYTPIMIFSLIGLAMMVRKKEKLALAILVTFLLYLYTVSCWWDWWFGGSFGYRALIDMFPLLAIGMAYFISKLLKYKMVLKTSILSLMFLLMGYNLFQTRQSHEALIHHDSMTWAAYKKIFLKLAPSIYAWDLEPYLDHPDYDAARRGERDQ
ncbi:MAG: hypothetical protein R2780_13860 [Crocinitomicaceae bacterium]